MSTSKDHQSNYISKQKIKYIEIPYDPAEKHIQIIIVCAMQNVNEREIESNDLLTLFTVSAKMKITKNTEEEMLLYRFHS